MSRFNKWLDTLVDEKGIDLHDSFDIENENGLNMIDYGFVIAAIKSTTDGEQAAIKTMLVKIDFHNGDICHYFRHLAQAII